MDDFAKIIDGVIEKLKEMYADIAAHTDEAKNDFQGISLEGSAGALKNMDAIVKVYDSRIADSLEAILSAIDELKELKDKILNGPVKTLRR